MFLLPHKVGPAGAYTLHRKLGTGGVAESYQGTHDGGAGRAIVIRRLLPYVTRDPARLGSITARIDDLLGVRHPFLVHVLDHVVEGEEHFLVEEFVDGVTLETVLAWCRQGGHHVPQNVFLNIATQVCNGLEALHGRAGKGTSAEHVLHHALKPSAIFITRDGKVLVGSYGLTRSPTTFPHGGVAGPVPTRMEYLSPEQTHPDQKLTPASDIFSLGALLYELLTLDSLFRAESNLQTIHRVRRAEVTAHLLRVKERMPGLDKVLFRALSLNPRHRYQRAFVLREDLRGLMAGYSFATIGEDTRAFLGPMGEGHRALPAGGGFVAGLDDAPEGRPGADSFDDSPATRIDPDPMTTAAIAAQALAARVALERGADALGERTEHTVTASEEPSHTPLPSFPLSPLIDRAVNPNSTAAWLGSPGRQSPTLTPELPAANPASEENTAAGIGLPREDTGSEISLSMPIDPPVDAPDRAPQARFSPPTLAPDVQIFAPPRMAPTPMIRESAEDPISARSASPVYVPPPNATLSPEASPAVAVVPPEPAPPPKRPSIADRAPPPGAYSAPPRPAEPARAPAPLPQAANDSLFEQPPAPRTGLFTTAAFAAFGLVILCTGGSFVGYRVWQGRSASEIAVATPAPAPVVVADPAATPTPATPESTLAEAPQAPIPPLADEAPPAAAANAQPTVASTLAPAPPPPATPKVVAPATPKVAAAPPPPATPKVAAVAPPKPAPKPAPVVASSPRPAPAPRPTPPKPAPVAATPTYSAPRTSSRTIAPPAAEPTAAIAVVPDAAATAALDGFGTDAKAGRLSSDDISTLESTDQADPNYTRSRAILLMNAQAKKDDGGQKRYLDQLLLLPENQYSPIYLADYARWSVNHGDYTTALDRAQKAERYWGRLPSDLVFTKKAEIYEVEAAAWQGRFYKSGEDLELLENAITGWQRYKTHVESKSRSDLAKRADTELAKLADIRERLQ